MIRVVALATVAFVLHFVWEMAQANFFSSMRGMSLLEGTIRCLQATAGDLVITAVAYLAAAAVARRWWWPAKPSAVSVIAFVLFGLAASIAFEKFALATGRWTYDARMPLVFGIGLFPLLQWIVIPSAELPLFRVIIRKPSLPRSSC